MPLIERANKSSAHLLSEIAGLTFIESHGTSAAPKDINNFIAEKYTPDIFTDELMNTKTTII